MTRQTILPEEYKLSNLLYGHPGKLILSLKGKFNPVRMNTPIQLGQLKCGCWVVLDGNNRIGLILKNNPDATLKTIPCQYFSYHMKGTWDETLITWENPYPKPYSLVIKHSLEINKIRRNKALFPNEEEYQRAITVHMNELDKPKHKCVPL